MRETLSPEVWLEKVLWVALGGAVGSAARYGVALWLGSEAFPWGTLAVNLVGSLLIGVLFAVGAERLGPTATLALGTGVLGGFTTYSTFSLDLFEQLRAGQWGLAAAYVGVTLCGGLAATALGFALGGWATRP